MSWGERAQITELRMVLLKIVELIDNEGNAPTLSELRRLALAALNQSRFQ